jgi:hypothetical protein
VAASQAVNQERGPIAGLPSGRLIIVQDDHVAIVEANLPWHCGVGRQRAWPEDSAERLGMPATQERMRLKRRKVHDWLGAATRRRAMKTCHPQISPI